MHDSENNLYVTSVCGDNQENYSTLHSSQEYFAARGLMGYVVAEPPPLHEAVIPVPPPALSKLACVTIQPWPPPVPRSTPSPTNPGISGIYSAIKPGVSYPLSEGFKGGREISDIDILYLYFRSVISF